MYTAFCPYNIRFKNDFMTKELIRIGLEASHISQSFRKWSDPLPFSQPPPSPQNRRRGKRREIGRRLNRIIVHIYIFIIYIKSDLRLKNWISIYTRKKKSAGGMRYPSGRWSIWSWSGGIDDTIQVTAPTLAPPEPGWSFWFCKGLSIQ